MQYHVSMYCISIVRKILVPDLKLQIFIPLYRYLLENPSYTSKETALKCIEHVSFPDMTVHKFDTYHFGLVID